MSDVHVLPIDDTRPHIERRECPCQPTLETIYGSPDAVVCHRSYDGREYFEPDGPVKPQDPQ